MPELPEVETVRRALEATLVGARISAASVCHPRTARRHPGGGALEDRLVNSRVLRAGRIGKFLLLELDSDLIWVLHLGMSGRIRLVASQTPLEVHTRFWADMHGAPSLRFVDPRTFGFVAVLTPRELAESTLARLGPDAWNRLPPSELFSERMAGRSIAVKSLLLDQRFLAGLGNIYADEVLHRAGIHPARPAGTLSQGEVRRLRSQVSPVLSEAITRGGTSLDDLAYLLPDGRAGDFLRYLRVYGRDGKPCRSCGAPILRMVIGARSSFFCLACQVR